MDMAIQAGAVTTGAMAAAAYLDAKFFISKDWNVLRRMKMAERNWVDAGTLHTHSYTLLPFPFLHICGFFYFPLDVNCGGWIVLILNDIVKRHQASGWFLFLKHARSWPDATCIWSRTGVYTWLEMEILARKYGAFFRERGVRPGEYVGLCLMNCPEFVGIWLGLLGIGEFCSQL
jgi:hypothetical protein